MHPDFEKRTLGSIIKDGISYVNISAYSSKEKKTRKGLKQFVLKICRCRKWLRYITPLDGYTGTVYNVRKMHMNLSQ